MRSLRPTGAHVKANQLGMTSWSTSMYHGWCKVAAPHAKRLKGQAQGMLRTCMNFFMHIAYGDTSQPFLSSTALRLSHRMAIATLTPMYSAFLWRSNCMLFPRLGATPIPVDSSHCREAKLAKTAKCKTLQNKTHVKVAAPETCLKHRHR